MTPQETKKQKATGKFAQFLAKKTVKDLLGEKKQQDIITLQHNMTVAEALRTLNKNKITSAPVVLAASVMDNDSEDFLGIIDAGEILRKLCRETTMMEDIQKVKSKNINADELIEDVEKTFEECCKAFWGRKLIQVCGQDVTLLPTVYEETDLKVTTRALRL